MSLKPKVLLAKSENLYLNESICHTLIEKNIEKKAIKSIVEKNKMYQFSLRIAWQFVFFYFLFFSKSMAVCFACVWVGH